MWCTAILWEVFQYTDYRRERSGAMSKRSYQIENQKIILMFCVIFGHLLESVGGGVQSIQGYILLSYASVPFHKRLVGAA